MKDSFARSRAGYIPTLDGWRAVAIMGVMVFHGGPLFPGRGLLGRVQDLGASGVELFFAISGILICTRLLDEEDLRGSISLRDFYLRRFFRIQPAAMAYLLVIVALAVLGVIAFSSAGWWTALLSVRNLYRSAHEADGSIYTAHFWSLALEEHFYLILPWLLLLLRGRNRMQWFGLVAGASFLAEQVMERTAIAKMAINSEFELCWLFLAAWVALLIRQPAIKERFRSYLPAGPVVAIMSVIGLGVALKWKLVWHFWFPGFPLLILATILHPQSVPSRFLEWKPMRMIGRISYSLYLWQQLFCLPLLEVPAAKLPLGWMQHRPQSYLFSIACAFASYFLVEKPFLRMGHRFASRVLPVRPTPALTVVHGGD